MYIYSIYKIDVTSEEEKVNERNIYLEWINYT